MSRASQAPITAYIGLGSNLDNPRQQVERALAALTQIGATHLLAASPLYRTRAIGPGQQPDFINGVAKIATTLAPHDLLDALQAIEQAHQRVRTLRWGPRTLDLDLLLYGDEVIDSERLQVPHPQLTRRNFVLCPLADLEPELTLPSGEALASLLARCPDNELTRLPGQ